jgi:hypothetical protein
LSPFLVIEISISIVEFIFPSSKSSDDFSSLVSSIEIALSGHSQSHTLFHFHTFSIAAVAAVVHLFPARATKAVHLFISNELW